MKLKQASLFASMGAGIMLLSSIYYAYINLSFSFTGISTSIRVIAWGLIFVALITFYKKQN